MPAIWGWLVKTLGPMILNWIAGLIHKTYVAYQTQKANRAENKELKEAIKNAKTEEEKQAAINRLASRLGRKP